MRNRVLVCNIICGTCVIFCTVTYDSIILGEWDNCDTKPSDKFKTCTNKNCVKDWLEQHKISYFNILDRSFRGKDTYVLIYDGKKLDGSSGYTNSYVVTVYIAVFVCLIFVITSIAARIINNRYDIIEESEEVVAVETDSMLDRRLNMFNLLYDIIEES
jgi:hypothetical protein